MATSSMKMCIRDRETDVDDLAAILEQLDASMEYNKDGYSGVLTLDQMCIRDSLRAAVMRHSLMP